ncbi:MAG: hypothetical protein HGB15_06725 [Chlorobaculum sp.]|nr:hypothetical protein [Chlorobaculum sp.]
MRQFRCFSTALLLAAPVLLSGCGSSYTTQKPFTTEKVNMWNVDLYYKYTKTDSLGTSGTDAQGAYFWSAYDGESDSDKKKIIRNKIMYELMFVIDDNYNDFEERLRSNAAIKSAWAEIVSQALSTTGAIIPAGNATRVLAAVDTGWKGSNKAFDQHILAGKMMDSIIKSMRASRDQEAAKIFKNMEAGVETYPLAAGLKDLGKYKRQGSLDTAMTFIAEEVGIKAKAAADSANEAATSLANPD